MQPNLASRDGAGRYALGLGGTRGKHPDGLQTTIFGGFSLADLDIVRDAEETNLLQEILEANRRDRG